MGFCKMDIDINLSQILKNCQRETTFIFFYQGREGFDILMESFGKNQQCGSEGNDKEETRRRRKRQSATRSRLNQTKTIADLELKVRSLEEKETNLRRLICKLRKERVQLLHALSSHDERCFKRRSRKKETRYDNEQVHDLKVMCHPHSVCHRPGIRLINKEPNRCSQEKIIDSTMSTNRLEIVQDVHALSNGCFVSKMNKQATVSEGSKSECNKAHASVFRNTLGASGVGAGQTVSDCPKPGHASIVNYKDTSEATYLINVDHNAFNDAHLFAHQNTSTSNGKPWPVSNLIQGGTASFETWLRSLPSTSTFIQSVGLQNIFQHLSTVQKQGSSLRTPNAGFSERLSEPEFGNNHTQLPSYGKRRPALLNTLSRDMQRANNLPVVSYTRTSGMFHLDTTYIADVVVNNNDRSGQGISQSELPSDIIDLALTRTESKPCSSVEDALDYLKN